MDRFDNTGRALKSILSVDGWIARFDEEDAANVHVDVVFREGAFGSDPSSKVSFKLSLKRAEKFLCIPDGEPIAAIKKSIRRSKPQTESKETSKRETRRASDGAASLAVSPASGFDIGLSAKGSVGFEDTSTTETIREVREHLEQHFKGAEGQPGWEFRRVDRAPLRGSPFDAADEPVAKIRRTSERNCDGDRPSLKIEIRCKREDFHITDLEPKDPAIRERWLQKSNKDLRLAAAEQIIRDELAKAGFLEIPNMAEKFSDVLVADVIIFEDV